MQFVKTLPEISTVKDDIFDLRWAQEFHISIHHELIYIIKGVLKLTYEVGTCFIAKQGDILIHPALRKHKDVFEEDEEMIALIIHFSWEKSEEFFSKVNNELLANLNSRTLAEIKNIFDIMRYDKGMHEIDRIVANTRLLNILLLIYRDAVCPDDMKPMDLFTKQKQLVLESKKYINRFFRDPITLNNVAAYLNVSPFYLSRIFSRENGFSLIGYLAEVRIEEAKKLLKEKRFIIADVAGMVGFNNRNYFSRIFKKKVGCSPKEYC